MAKNVTVGIIANPVKHAPDGQHGESSSKAGEAGSDVFAIEARPLWLFRPSGEPRVDAMGAGAEMDGVPVQADQLGEAPGDGRQPFRAQRAARSERKPRKERDAGLFAGGEHRIGIEIEHRPGADAFDVMVMAFLGRTHLGLEAQNLGAVFAHAAVHVVRTAEDLAKQFEAKGMKGMGIKLIPRRFYDPALSRYCRHELMHISDMLDPVFGYDPDTKVGQNPGEETLILHRYRVLWSLSVDSRLVRAGKEPMLSKEDRFKEFRSWYRKIPPAQLKSAFEGLWQTESFTHAELVEMASDTLRVLDRAVDVEGGEIPEAQTKVMLMPGFPCPLCRFPTYSWVEQLEQKVIPSLEAVAGKRLDRDALATLADDVGRFLAGRPFPHRYTVMLAHNVGPDGGAAAARYDLATRGVRHIAANVGRAGEVHGALVH